MYPIIRRRPVYHKLIALVTASFFFLSIFTSDVLALAPELRSKPFSEATKIAFQQIYEMMLTAGKLKALIQNDEARPGNMERLNNELKARFPNGEVVMEAELKDGRLNTGTEYKYAVFHFKKENRSVEARFFKEDIELKENELKELGVKTTEDRRHFFNSPEHPALRGVWFVDPERHIIEHDVAELERFRKEGRRIIQIVGRPASGKSAATKYLAKRPGFYTIEMDDILLFKPSKRLQDRVKAIIGNNIYLEDGSINMSKLVQDPAILPRYQQAAMPVAEQEIRTEALGAFRKGYKTVVIDFLFPLEAISSLKCDQTIFIDRPEETRIKSVLDRSAHSEYPGVRELIMMTEHMLPTADEYRSMSTHTVVNNGTKHELHERTYQLIGLGERPSESLVQPENPDDGLLFPKGQPIVSISALGQYRTALYPGYFGEFDKFGGIDVIQDALKVYDRLVILITGDSQTRGQDLQEIVDRTYDKAKELFSGKELDNIVVLGMKDKSYIGNFVRSARISGRIRRFRHVVNENRLDEKVRKSRIYHEDYGLDTIFAVPSHQYLELSADAGSQGELQSYCRMITDMLRAKYPANSEYQGTLNKTEIEDLVRKNGSIYALLEENFPEPDPAIALYPGSFDPVTNGHLEVIRQASRVYKKVIIAIGQYPTKKPMFSLEEKKRMMEDALISVGITNVELVTQEGSGNLFKIAAERQAGTIIRGVRDVKDLRYELNIAWFLQMLNPRVRTALLTPHQYEDCSSSKLKATFIEGGEISELAPGPVFSELMRRRLNDLIKDTRIIGVVGGIAAGKTTILREIANNRDAAVIEMDRIGQEVRKLPEVRARLQQAFGKDVFRGEDIDRDVLSKRMFDSPRNVFLYNNILRSYLLRKTYERIVAIKKEKPDARLIAIEWFGLVDVGLDRLTDEMWYVDTPAETRMRRALADLNRNGLNEGMARGIINVQEETLERARDKADIVIENSGDIHAIKKAVRDRIAILLRHRPIETDMQSGRFGTIVYKRRDGAAFLISNTQFSGSAAVSPIGTMIVDPKRVRVDIQHLFNAQGNLRIYDRSINRREYRPGPNEQATSDSKLIRSRFLPFGEAMKESMQNNPGADALTWLDFSNNFGNPNHVSFVRDRLFYPTGINMGKEFRQDFSKPLYSFVQYPNGEIEFEYVKYEITKTERKEGYYDAVYAKAFVGGRELPAGTVAFSAIPLVVDNKPVDLQSSIKAGMFQDLRHLFGLPLAINPKNAKGNQFSLENVPVEIRAGIFFGMEELSANNYEKAAQALNHPISLPTTISITHEKKITLTKDQTRALLATAGYAEETDRDRVTAQQPEEGKYLFTSDSDIVIFLKAGVYPHLLIGRTNNGNLIVQSIGGSSGRVGISIKEAFKHAHKLGLKDLMSMSQGTGSLIGYLPERAGSDPALLENSYHPVVGASEGRAAGSAVINILSVQSIDADEPPAVPPVGQDLTSTKFGEEADRIHAENLKLTRTIEDKTLICHIVTDSILPDMQLKEGVLNRLEVKMRDPKYGEKVVALSVQNPDNADEYMTKLSELKRQIESEYKDYKVQFDVACPKPEYVESIQKLGMQALAFKREGEGEMIQIEGIILALRALRTGSITSLISAYKTITGKDYTTNKTDINELAKIMLFILPVRKIDVDKIGTINKLIEENIKAAA